MRELSTTMALCLPLQFSLCGKCCLSLDTRLRLLRGLEFGCHCRYFLLVGESFGIDTCLSSGRCCMFCLCACSADGGGFFCGIRACSCGSECLLVVQDSRLRRRECQLL